MTPVEVLKLIAEQLIKEDCQFAVCGGVAASIYRTDFRTTNDLDIAIAFPQEVESKSVCAESEREFAISFLEKLGFKATLGWSPGIAREAESNVFFVIGESQGFVPRVDLLLPNLPWVRQAVLRAQDNLIDYRFAKLPTITPEDLVISKAFALSFDSTRPFDQDDINSILEEGAIEDHTYLDENLKRLNLNIKNTKRLT